MRRGAPTSRAEAKVLSSHFYFPTIDVAATMIAKTGNTSLKTFLVAAETVSRNHHDESARLAQFPFELAEGLSIHGDHSPIHQFRVERFVDEASVRLVILREPHRRFVSMFGNKFIDQQDPWIRLEYGDLDWSPDPFDSLEVVRAKVIEMLRWLNDGHLFEDPHWRPQSAFLAAGLPYNLVVDTTRLHETPRRIGALEPQLEWLADLKMPHRNTSNNALQELLLTTDSAALIDATYAADIELRRSFGLDQIDPWHFDCDRHVDPDTWSQAQLQMAARRLANVSRHLESVISQMESSRSWRLTRPLRDAANLARRVTPQR
jgi:hypothetical protein